MSTKRKKILPSVFSEPMSYAQLVSLRHTFGTPEKLSEAILDSGLTKDADEAMRRARMVFCAPPEPGTRGTGKRNGKAAPKSGTETPKVEGESAEEGPPPEAAAPAQRGLHAIRREMTPKQMTETILSFAETMKLGPDQGWSAAKSLLELAMFNKMWGVQAQIQLTRILEGQDLSSQRALMALGSYPYSSEVDQLALQRFLGRPKCRAVLERWAATIGHPLRGNASMFLTFLARRPIVEPVTD